MSEITYINSRLIGNIGEAEALAEFTKHQIPVFFPFGQNNPFDLLLYINNKFIKIQVKTTEKIKNGVMSFELCRTNGFKQTRIPYTSNEVDYFFLYCIENGYKGLVPFNVVNNQKQISIRILPTKNNQVSNIKTVNDFDITNQINNIKGEWYEKSISSSRHAEGLC